MERSHLLSGLLHDLGKCDIHKRLDKESSLPYTGDEQLEDKQAEYKETCVEDSQIDLFVVCVPTPLDENRNLTLPWLIRQPE